jgi:acetyl-CoA synthetase
MELREDDVGYTPIEWSWVGSLYTAVLPSLYYGIPVLADTDPRYDPKRMFELIERYEVTITGGPSTVYRMLMQVPEPGERYDLSSLRVAVQGGEALGQTIIDWLHDTVNGIVAHEVYGQTEAPFILGDCEALGVEHRSEYMGRSLPGHTVQVVDPENTRPVAHGDIGELAIRYEGDPICFSGFWNEPAKTEQRIRDGWLLTGDLAMSSGDGYFSFHSRVDDVIISSGYRIGPSEIEECLARHDAVGNVGVIGVPDDERGEIPKAFVVVAEGVEPTPELKNELQAHVKTQLAKYEYPRELEFVAELPMTVTRKVRRRDLRKTEGLIESA